MSNPELVAKWTIVAKNVQIILKPCNVWKVHCCGKTPWQIIFFVEHDVCVKKIFHPEKTCLSACPKRKEHPINPCQRTGFPQFYKTRGHERAQFTLVGVLPGFTFAANFSRADPGEG